jgi:hypothetical protein
MDDILWNLGQSVAANRSHVRAWELDFLRGMHAGPAVRMLARYLQLATNQDIRLMSIWMDKHAWASWTNASGATVKRRELADLAVIVRRRHGPGIARWMWLVQAKRTAKLLAPYSGRSSVHELDLLHRIPDFTLSGVTKPFQLNTEFLPTASVPSRLPWSADISVPWTFLDFDLDRLQLDSANSNGYSPIAPRWPGDTALVGSWAALWQAGNTYPNMSLGSYTQCLLSIIQGHAVSWHDPQQTGTNRAKLVPGAPIDDPRYPEWSRLYAALVRTGFHATSGHAKSTGNPQGSIIQLSKFLTSHSKFGPLFSRWDSWTYSQSMTENMHWAISSKNDIDPFLALEDFDKLEGSDEELIDIPPFEPTEIIRDEEEPSGMQVLIVDALGD